MIETLTRPRNTAYYTFDDGKTRFYSNKYPNAFHRFLQKRLLSIDWVKTEPQITKEKTQ